VNRNTTKATQLNVNCSVESVFTRHLIPWRAFDWLAFTFWVGDLSNADSHADPMQAAFSCRVLHQLKGGYAYSLQTIFFSETLRVSWSR
jgi:hypothetical protein